jgi:hypothetical protein
MTLMELMALSTALVSGVGGALLGGRLGIAGAVAGGILGCVLGWCGGFFGGLGLLSVPALPENGTGNDRDLT